MSNKLAYIALTGPPNDDDDGENGVPPWPPLPPPPPGTTRQYIGLSYRSTGYTINASLNTAATLVTYDGQTVRSDSTFPQAVAHPAGGYVRSYVQMPNGYTAQTVGLPSCYVTNLKTATLRAATYIDFSGNLLSASQVESVLAGVNAFGTSLGYVDLRSNTAISSGNSDKAQLESRGWTVLVDEVYIGLGLFVSTPGLNQWTTIKPLVEAAAFTTAASYASVETQYGFYSGPDNTQVYLEAHQIAGGSFSALSMDYKRYGYRNADVLTYSLVVSQTEPTVGSDLLAWDEFGTITPADDTSPGTTYNVDVSACLAFVDSTQDFWISAISKPHFDGNNPATWPNANANGGSYWMNMQGFHVS